jgi:tetratricopeptide (TPR) repeat protein
MSPMPSGLSRNILIGLMVTALSVGGASAVYVVIKAKPDLFRPRPTADYQKLEKENQDLKKKYEELELDRNNVLSQTKNLLQEKAQWSEMEVQLENLKKANKSFMAQKDKLLQDNERLKAEVAAVIQNFDALKQSYQEMLEKQDAIDKENTSLRTLLTQQVQSSPEFQVLDREAKRLREDNAQLGETISVMESKLRKALERIKKDQTREMSMIIQIRGQKQLLDEIQLQNTTLSKTNTELNELINQAPEKIRLMAAQNKSLLKETAEMHYNMAVFFTQGQKYKEAEREYVRALEFDPNNLKIHYNLGYLYAEEMDKHDKAMYHLEKYLQIDPNSKESEAIRSYIATHQTLNGGGLSRGKK